MTSNARSPSLTSAPLIQEMHNLRFDKKLILLVLPLVFMIVSLVMRHNAGPFWLWSNLDPDYLYIFDSLNLINLQWPQFVGHPGTTLQWLGALVIKGMHPFDSAAVINQLVLTNPEHYLTIIGRGLILLNTLALILVGMVGYLVFRDLIPALFLQIGPFLSKLIFKWTLHVAPEPLLITVVIGISIVTLLALRDGQLEQSRGRYAIAFGVIAGFGMISKISSAGLYLLPVFLLWNSRALFLYGFAAIFAMIVFSLPNAGSYDVLFERMAGIIFSSGYHGKGDQTFIDLGSYPRELLRVSSRPMFFVILLVGLGLVGATLRKCRATAQPFPVVGRALAGLCLAYVGQALLVAKHPAGHYMLPVLGASALGMALIYQLSKELMKPDGPGLKRLRTGAITLLIILIGTQSNSLIGLNKEFSERTANAFAIDETPYQKCARIYFWPAAQPLYAMFWGSWNTNYSFAKELAELDPKNNVMIYTYKGELRSMNGLLQPKAIAEQYACIYARGANPHTSLKVLDDAFSSYPIKGRCQDGDEAVFTWGIDCAQAVK
jgi:hypothetical protein